jgi:hypothetical protein
MANEETEELVLKVLQRHYAALAAWIVRDNRLREAARPSEPDRSLAQARLELPSRQQQLARQW